MSYTHVLEITSHWAGILTALVAAGAYAVYRWDIHSKRIQLENYLKAEKAAARDKGQRTILHLMARLGLTEAEVCGNGLKRAAAVFEQLPLSGKEVCSLVIAWPISGSGSGQRIPVADGICRESQAFLSD